MKELTIIRHAKSSWDYPDLSDFDRPLSLRGKSNTRLMGERLLKNNIFFDGIISSGAERAKATAEIIAKTINFPKHKIKLNNDLYMASVLSMIDIIRESPAEYKSIALIGHNPSITELVNYLTNDTIEDLPTCFNYQLTLPINSWVNVKQGIGEGKYFNYPKSKHDMGVLVHKLPVI